MQQMKQAMDRNAIKDFLSWDPVAALKSRVKNNIKFMNLITSVVKQNQRNPKRWYQIIAGRVIVLVQLSRQALPEQTNACLLALTFPKGGILLLYKRCWELHNFLSQAMYNGKEDRAGLTESF